MEGHPHEETWEAECYRLYSIHEDGSKSNVHSKENKKQMMLSDYFTLSCRHTTQLGITHFTAPDKDYELKPTECSKHTSWWQ